MRVAWFEHFKVGNKWGFCVARTISNHQFFTGQSARRTYGFLKNFLRRKWTVVPMPCINLSRITNTEGNVNCDGWRNFNPFGFEPKSTSREDTQDQLERQMPLTVNFAATASSESGVPVPNDRSRARSMYTVLWSLFGLTHSGDRYQSRSLLSAWKPWSYLFINSSGCNRRSRNWDISKPNTEMIRIVRTWCRST
jgi:hypothetical protein